MSWWQWTIIIVVGVYLVGGGIFWAVTGNAKMAAIWPLWVLFGLFGNIQ